MYIAINDHYCSKIHVMQLSIFSHGKTCNHIYSTATIFIVQSTCLQFCHNVDKTVHSTATMFTIMLQSLQYCQHVYSTANMSTALKPCLQLWHHVYNNVSKLATLPSCFQYHHQIYSSADIFTVVPHLQHCHNIYSTTTSFTVLYHVYSMDIPIQLSLEPPFVLHSSVPASPHMCQSCTRSGMATCSARRTAAGKSRAGPGTCVAQSPSAPWKYTGTWKSYKQGCNWQRKKKDEIKSFGGLQRSSEWPFWLSNPLK